MDKIKPRDYIYIDYNLYFGYDENDDELCISFIDKLNYRRTLSICIEMYMRRQLKVYHGLQSIPKLAVNVAAAIHQLKQPRRYKKTGCTY